MKQSARMLGKIHTALLDYPPLPEGIGEQFFKYCTVDSTLRGYSKTLEHAIAIGDTRSAEEISSNIKILKRMPNYIFDLKKLTFGNTHGDFVITQLICGEDKINGCIDWTTACIHPLIWEVMRSFVYASPSCSHGEIDIESFKDYVRTYLKYAKLNSYDLENMGKLFFYFTAVCNFYEQYFEAITKNRVIYLKQARLSSKLLCWFDKNIDSLTDAMKNLY